MKLLAFDTSTEACSVALSLDGEVRERHELHSQHSEHLLSLVDALLAEGGIRLDQLDAIAFGRGPGSFTGLRIGAGVAQGLAFGADLPLVPVSSLATLAQGAKADKVLAAFDARMQQVYWCAYRRGEKGLVEPVMDEVVINPTDVSQPEGEGWVGVGSGWDSYPEILCAKAAASLQRWEAKIYPRARDLAVLAAAAFSDGQVVSADQALPVYVRDEVARKTGTSGRTDGSAL